MRLVYIVGPYTGADWIKTGENIDRAEEFSFLVAQLGAMPVCPHSLTRRKSIATAQPYEFWIAGTMRLLERCDAAVTAPGWRNSRGSVGEVARAGELGIPVFHGIQASRGREAFAAWLEANP